MLQQDQKFDDGSPLISSYSLFLTLCTDGFFRPNDPDFIRSRCRRRLDLLKTGDVVFLVIEELSAFVHN